MRVIILFSESIHYGLAAANRVINYAKGLQRNGSEVEIIMPFGFIARESVTFPQKGKFDDANYCYLSYLPFHPRNKFFLPIAWLIIVYKRNLGYMRYLKYLRKAKYDLVYFYRFGTFFSIMLLLFKQNRPAISELCEIPYFDRKGLSKIFHRLIREKLLFPFFDGYIVISQNLHDYILQHMGKRAKLIKIPILIDDLQDPTIPESTPNFNSYGTYILHTGSLTEKKDGILGIIEACGIAFKDLKNPVKLVLTSFLEAAPEKKTLNRYIQKWDIKGSIIFTGFLPKETLRSTLQHAYLAIINKYPNEQNYYNFPTKLGEYLANGVPVITSNVGEMNNYLKDGVNSFIFNAGDTHQLAEKILIAFRDKEELRKVANNGKKLALKEFGCTYHGKRIVGFFNEIINLKLNDTY